MHQYAATKLGPGVYMNGDQLEVIIPEILAHLGLEDTEENRDRATEMFIQLTREKNPMAQLAVAMKCPVCKGRGRTGPRKTCQRCGGNGQIIEEQ